MRGRGVLRFGARSALLGVVLAVVVSGSALAARIHVDIQAPQHVNAGHKVVLVFVGYTTPKFGWLAVFLDNRACARTGVAESNRAESREFDYAPIHGYADHCRVFTEAELRARFGERPGFRLAKIPGAWKHGELPDCFEPIEFGSFFVSYATKG